VRLRPYTTALPKPLVPIGDHQVILEVVLQQLASQGFTDVVLAINHFGALIRAFIGDGSRWGLRVDYAEEDAPLSTVGPLFALRDRLPEHFLVMNGDVLTDLPFGHLLNSHVAADAALTVATAPRTTRIDFGVLEINAARIVGFAEKPAMNYHVSMGVYGMARKTLAPYRPGLSFGFDELVKDLIEAGQPPASYEYRGYWLDIGRPDDYDEANRNFAELAPILLRSNRNEELV
jgi:NDP-sugar pyrophosphorylase family protein